MKKKTDFITTKELSSSRQMGLLVEQVRYLVQSARRTAATHINSLQVLTNFEIGRLIRCFFLQYRDRFIQICQKPSGKLRPTIISQRYADQLSKHFTLSWSHYVLLLGIKDTKERSFYKKEPFYLPSK